MDDKLKQKFKQQFEILPKEVQMAISDMDLSAKLQEVVKNNKLMIDQAGFLEIETISVLFGIEPIDNYVNNLIKNVHLSIAQASVVAHDVNELIFKNIRESLKKMSGELGGIEKKIGGDENNLTRESVLSGIENPETIKGTEKSVSISSQKSNSENLKTPEAIKEKTEENNLPEIAPVVGLPAISSLASKPTEPFHKNISPLQNIVESKLNNMVAIPKKNIVIEEKTKLPEKAKNSGDPYRESII